MTTPESLIKLIKGESMNCYKCDTRMHRFKPDENYKIECCQNKECKEYGKAYDIERTAPYKKSELPLNTY